MKFHLMFLVGLLAAQTASGGEAATHHGHHDSAHGAGNRAVGQPGHPDRIDRSIAVIASDTMRYDPPEITVRPGETIRFEVKNDGKLRHEFTIGDATEQRAHSEMMKRDPDMVHNDPNTITVEARSSEDPRLAVRRSGRARNRLPRSRSLRSRNARARAGGRL